ncbi:MAG: hypothetical protein ACJ8G8_06300, partial [Pseudomonas sp.]
PTGKTPLATRALVFAEVQQKRRHPCGCRLFHGKPEVNGQRRLGVALARDESIEAARAKATRASQAVKIEL